MGTCPYGIAACWGDANEALRSLEGVDYVDPIPQPGKTVARPHHPLRMMWRSERCRRVRHAGRGPAIVT